MTYLHSFGPRHPCSFLFATVTAPLESIFLTTIQTIVSRRSSLYHLVWQHRSDQQTVSESKLDLLFKKNFEHSTNIQIQNIKV